MINKNKFIEGENLRWLRRLYEQRRTNPNLAKDEFPTQIAKRFFCLKVLFYLYHLPYE